MGSRIQKRRKAKLSDANWAGLQGLLGEDEHLDFAFYATNMLRFFDIPIQPAYFVSVTNRRIIFLRARRRRPQGLAWSDSLGTSRLSDVRFGTWVNVQMGGLPMGEFVSVVYHRPDGSTARLHVEQDWLEEGRAFVALLGGSHEERTPPL